MKALRQEDAMANFRCWGGDLMQQAGGELVKHYKNLAFMGVWEVIKHLPTIAKNIDFCKKDITNFQPDVLILVDYSGFNLRIAKWAKAAGFIIFYYISPQIWASRQKRVFAIKKWVDRMFVILPFEKDYYEKFEVKVDFVGHPLLDAISDFKKRKTKKSGALNESDSLKEITKPIIALLPGSRKQEINIILKIMLPLGRQFTDYQFVVAVAPSVPLSFYKAIFRKLGINEEGVIFLQDQTYHLLNNAKAALVTSGTATLETALFEVPQVVCYKTNWLTFQIAKRVVKVPYISLVNLIANCVLVKELIQEELTVENLKIELAQILNKEKALYFKEAYQKIKVKLGKEGASERAAKLMIGYLVKPKK